MKNSPADTKVRQERGGRGAPGTGAEIPLKPVEDHAGADSHTAAHGGHHAGGGGYFLTELQPVESPHWSKIILKDFSLWRGPTLEQGKSVRRKQRQRGAVMD